MSLEPFLKALSGVHAAHVASVVAGALILMIVGFVSSDLQLEDPYAVTAILITVAIVLSFIAYVLKKHATPKFPAGEGWAWKSGHRALPIMRQTLDFVQLACEHAGSPNVDSEERWRKLSYKIWALRARGSLWAVVVQLEVLDDRYRAQLVRNVREGKTDVPLKAFAAELYDAAESILVEDPPVTEELKNELTKLQEKLKLPAQLSP